MNQEGSQFIDPSKKSLYGKEGGQFWIGKIVAYADQEDQLDDGFGWRYKVRILGDNSDTDQIEDSYLTYATVLLPTTAGTGAAYKLRSVRLSQGDMVFGVRGGGTAAPKFIIGAFPRTTKTINHKDERGNPTYGKTGKFDTPKGFYGSLKENSTLSGEFNEQIGPKTPSTDPVGPKNYSKAEKKEPSVKAKELGVIAGGDENVNVEEKLTPKKIFLSLKDYTQNLLKGKDAVNSKENLEKIIEDVNENKSRTNTEIEVAKKAIDTSVKQNLIEKEEAVNKKKELNKLEVVNVNNQGIILNSETVRDGLLTYVDENGKQFVKLTSPSGKVTFEPADKVRKSSAKTKAYIDRIENEETTYEISSTASESTETFTTSSDETYDASTNTFTSSTTTRQTTSGLVVGSEAPKTVTDIKLRLVQNELTVKKMIRLYQKGNLKEKTEIAQRHLRELKTIDPTTYDGSSLQTELKSSYTGIMY